MKKIKSIFEKRFKYYISDNYEETLTTEFNNGDVVLVNGKPKIIRKAENTRKGDYLLTFADGSQAIFVYYNKKDMYDFLGEWRIIER